MRLFWGLFFFFFAISATAQIVVETDTYTTAQLVRDILINSNCAQTSNYSAATGLSEGVNGIGYFNANGSSFQFHEGIVLSTGNAVDSQGPNTSIFNTKPTGWAGDADLSRISDVPVLYNASYIQFDFVPNTNNINFNFLFASEEYDDIFQCIFTDVFAFILTGPDGVSTNLALVPDTNELVSATTIRPGIPDLCEPVNERYFYGVNGFDSPISQFGQTISMKASAAVIPLETYTIKLVIADNADAEYDSAVYLEAGSFSFDVSLGEDRTIAGGNPLCDGERIRLNAEAQGALDYIWYRDGIEISSEKNQPAIVVSESGVYEVEVVFSTNCRSHGEIELDYVNMPILDSNPLDLSICDIEARGSAIFDFSENTARILGSQDANIYQVNYYHSLDDAQRFQNAIDISNGFESSQASQEIFVRISSAESCFLTDSFMLNIQPIEFTSDLKETYVLCLDEAGNPIAPFPVLDTGLSSTDHNFQWYRNAISKNNLIQGATQSSYTADDKGTYYVQISILSMGCELSISTKVMALSPPESVSVDLVSELFDADTIVDVLVDGTGEFLYSIDDGPEQESNRFNGVAPGIHTAFVSDINGCVTISEEFFIIDYPKFFTPNSDGRNDTWTIVGLDQIESPEITIYNRNGKLLYQFFTTSWDGTLKGRPLPSSDYWFRISYGLNGARKEYKGHFSLKR